MATKRISNEIKKLVLGYTNRLERDGGVRVGSVYVYGSHAKGTATRHSDIDVCIISPTFQDSLKASQWLFKHRTADEVLAGIEPVGFSSKWFRQGGILADEIKRSGVKIR